VHLEQDEYPLWPFINKTLALATASNNNMEILKLKCLPFIDIPFKVIFKASFTNSSNN